MRRARALLAALALALAPWPPLPAQQPTRADSSRAAAPAAPATVITPAADQARGVDAELRAALFDLTAGRPLAALERLEWLRGSDSVFAGAPEAGGAMRSRDDLLFLLAESYYRLGLGGAFRSAARELAASPGGARYAGVIRAQLVLDAYRRGDDATVRALAGEATGGDRALTALVRGLTAYRGGDFTAARGAFAAARAAGGAYAPYAQYMEAMAVLQGDTSRAGAALDSLRPLAGMATGELGDQVRLTAAELAYESGQYEAAIRFARGVSPASGLGPQALLVTAWSQYRGGALEEAGRSFAEFAARHPELPQRDEARLMVGQVLLESGQSEPAERYFEAVADSITGEVTALRSRASAALESAARALVAARAAGIAFVHDPVDGKTLALPEGAGADAGTVLAGFAGTPAPPSRVPPRVVSLADVSARLDSIAPVLGPDFPRGLMYLGTADSSAAAEYARRADALLDADVRASLARYGLQEQLDAHAAKILALQDLQRMIASGNASLAANARTLAATRDSLAVMRVVIDRTRARVRQALATQMEATRRMAAENVAMIDSTRAALGASLGPAEADILDTERRTAETYGRMADAVQAGLDEAIGHHPVFALRDSVTVRLARANALHDETRGVLAADDSIVARALGELEGAEPPRARAMRAALAAAERQRAAAEGALVALVENELRQRATGMLALLGERREAADYGSASSAFFRATEPKGTATGASGTVTGVSAGTLARPTPAAPPAPPAPAPSKAEGDSTATGRRP